MVAQFFLFLISIHPWLLGLWACMPPPHTHTHTHHIHTHTQRKDGSSFPHIPRIARTPTACRGLSPRGPPRRCNGRASSSSSRGRGSCGTRWPSIRCCRRRCGLLHSQHSNYNSWKSIVGRYVFMAWGGFGLQFIPAPWKEWWSKVPTYTWHFYNSNSHSSWG